MLRILSRCTSSTSTRFKVRTLYFLITMSLPIVGHAQPAPTYEHFTASIYTRYYEVQQMQDARWMEQSWEALASQVKASKIYLETHRDRQLIDEATLTQAIRYFKSKGLQVAGGITLTISEPNRFETFCYSNPEHRAWIQQVVEFTARHFDELILDDFFFTNCKSAVEIAAKGNASWTDYRIALMRDAANELIIGPAKAVNPNVKVVVKYPNWYEHFQGLGFNLETQPHAFDGIYTGTETRDAVRSAQHLQPYLGYQIFRYFDNLNPGHNGGGWVDTGGASTVDRYAEQLWLTLFAKAPEITLFEFRGIANAIPDRLYGTWQNADTSFNYNALHSARSNNSQPSFASAAGIALSHVDAVLAELGNPVGVSSYRPYHATGEDFLHNYLGMAGIPIEMQPEFPTSAHTILLTQSAAADDTIVEKIVAHIEQGGNIVVTSGLLALLQERGIHQIAEISVTGRKAFVKQFQARAYGPLLDIAEPMLIPQISYLTNDSWELVSALSGPNGWPLLHDADYNDGHLYVMAVPDNFADLYRLPAPVLDALRQTIAQDMAVQLEGPAGVSIFMYDNNTLIVESFLDESTQVGLVGAATLTMIEDLQNGDVLQSLELPASGGFGSPMVPVRRQFNLELKPHSFRVLHYR